MLTKIVNGKEVQCSAEEEASILAEWAANAGRPPPKAQLTVEALAAALVREGVLSADAVASAATQERDAQPE